jgi:hypothetical protein
LPEYLTSQPKQVRANDDLVADSLFRAAIVSYARAFVSSEASRIQLGVELYDSKEKITHNELMHIRHSYISHAGYADSGELCFEFIATLVLLDPDKKISPEICAYNRRTKGLPLENSGILKFD